MSWRCSYQAEQKEKHALFAKTEHYVGDLVIITLKRYHQAHRVIFFPSPALMLGHAEYRHVWNVKKMLKNVQQRQKFLIVICYDMYLYSYRYHIYSLSYTTSRFTYKQQPRSTLQSKARVIPGSLNTPRSQPYLVGSCQQVISHFVQIWCLPRVNKAHHFLKNFRLHIIDFNAIL